MWAWAGPGSLAVAEVADRRGGRRASLTRRWGSPWVRDLSIFTHLPKVPSADVAVTPLTMLTVPALALAALGLAALRRRDTTA